MTRPATAKKPAFWIEDNYSIIVDPSSTLEERLTAFQERADWTRQLEPNGPFVELLTRMVSRFGELGVIERRKLPKSIPGLPDEMYVETVHIKKQTPAPRKKPSQSEQEIREARFEHLRK